VLYYRDPNLGAVVADSPDPNAVTRLLREWRGGSARALEQLMPLVYDELHAMAARQMAREWRVSTLQTTALVNEAYLKLVGQREVDWQNRAHFFALAARLMRRILVDNARRGLRTKRGAAAPPLPLDDALAMPQPEVDVVDTLALDAALQKLEALDPDQVRIIELRFFGGLTIEETADVIGSSPATVKREWALAKGWLHRELARTGVEPD
jgi:RNA polymerase sigma factor (TIGR02999 family)